LTSRPQRLSYNRHIVKRQRASADLLVLLVALPGNKDEVTRRCVSDCLVNRVAAIDDGEHVYVPLPRFGLRAKVDLIDDPLGILAARVV
jgi:hypothetical protein